MTRTLAGIHHVTAICGDPQQAVNFYAGTLGLRLVKRTVNFDDPRAYHLYFGDATGTPGTIVTFFAWPNAQRGTVGRGQITAIALAVPTDALPFWQRRLEAAGVPTRRTQRFDEDVLQFPDPDGLALELVASAGVAERPPWTVADIPPDVAIRGVQSVTLTVHPVAASGAMLVQVLGFRELARAGERRRFALGPGSAGAFIDLVDGSDRAAGRIAVGQVHHVAWRTPSEEEELAWRQDLLAHGYTVTPVIDRQYFRSIYFHEPGGVLYEIATDPPGFTRDEPVATLGSQLMLPPWLERYRPQLEATLPPLQLPTLPPTGPRA
ncbi:MAG: ring-cleaving dioxygenase [Chloroflexi bacterium]|nr:ring-cleaving dioxygenase [Chloroflexota bacterium]